MTDRSSVVFRIIAVICAIPTAFFTVYGILLVHAAITFEGEGSLGHVGMYIASVLFPLLALLFGGFTFLAWRRSKRGHAPRRPPNNG